MMETKEPDFIDMDSFHAGKDSGISFSQIVLGHVRRICELSTDEFKGGYVDHQLIKLHGGLTATNKVYVPDSRKRYTQAVDSLYDLLFSFFDDEMVKSDSALQKEIVKFGNDKDRMVLVKRKYFRALCSLLKRNNFLKVEDIA